MAAHVYWRLYITAAPTGYAGIAKWIPLDGGGSPIATTGGTASASTAYPGQPASSAFDGNASTFWLSNGSAPHWLQYQFSSAVDIVSFTLTNAPSGNDQHTPQDFTLDYSDNGTTWTTRYAYKGAGWGSVGRTITFDASNVAVASPVICWRLLITAAAGGANVSITDWRLFDISSTQIATATYSATASSTYTGIAESPYLALDGLIGTFWNSNGTPTTGAPEWLRYDFSSAVSVASISIQARNDGLYGQSPSTFKVQYSVDAGATWVTAGNYTAAAWTTPGQIQTFDVPAISVSPATAVQGAAVTLTVTGAHTHFASGTTTVSFSGGGITVGTITVASSTSLTVAITVAPTATVGPQIMTVTTGSEAPIATFAVTVGMFERGHIDFDQVRIVARQGPGSKFQMFGGGTITTGHAAVYDANGNVIDGGAPSTGSVTSVGLIMPAEFSVAGSPITTAGTLTATKANQSANQVYAGPSSGAAAPPAFRALAAADIPQVIKCNGVLVGV